MSSIIAGLILAGLFFLVVAAIGMVRLPDVFTRSHALSITDTLGVGLLLAGMVLYQGLTFSAVKTILILALLYHLNPIIAHATVRAALRSGIRPWTRGENPRAMTEGE
jgi:multicomponent Na+:H+ antiporter subunit G